MKSLQSYFSRTASSMGESSHTASDIDDKTIFYVFSRIISEEYGKQGVRAITPSFYRNKIIFVRFSQSLWAQEVWTNRVYLVRQLNDRLGKGVVVNIKSH